VLCASTTQRSRRVRDNELVFEFHGWVTLRDRATQEDLPVVADETVNHVKRLVKDVRKAATFVGGAAEVRAVNGEWHVIIHGLRNHRQGWVVDLYRSIAAEAPGSYGLLHVHDDEAEDDDRWVCWTMLRGRVDESTEQRLTPHFGRVEDDPYQEL